MHLKRNSSYQISMEPHFVAEIITNVIFDSQFSRSCKQYI